MKIIDISHQLSSRTPAWPGNPAFELSAVTRVASGDSSNVSRVVMGTHSGTHVDAPRHFIDEGPGVDQLALDELIGPCRVVEVGTGHDEISVADLRQAAGSPPPRRLLLKTRNGRLWESGRFNPAFAHVTTGAAEWLAQSGVRVIGIDYLSIEKFRTPGAPAHHALLGAGVIIIEGLNLAAVSPGDYELICLPLLIPGADGAPARVVLRT